MNFVPKVIFVDSFYFPRLDGQVVRGAEFFLQSMTLKEGKIVSMLVAETAMPPSDDACILVNPSRVGEVTVVFVPSVA